MRQCSWANSTQLIAYLTADTAAAPGMRVGFLPGVIWPLGWNYPGSCTEANSKCNTITSSQLNISAFFPCDRRTTTAIEECVTPVAVLQVPLELSSCPDAEMSIDGSRSTGSGIKPLIFTWGSDPSICDNYYQVQSRIVGANAGQIQSGTLGPAELAGGFTFVLWLRVDNFLGAQSAVVTRTITRATLPIPTMVILAPDVLYLRSTTSLDIRSRATLPTCFASYTLAVLFNWTNTAASLLDTGASITKRLVLDADTKFSRDLSLLGSRLEAGVSYTLRVTGCMAAAPTNCGFAEMQVALTPEPLVATITGGHTRQIGVDSSLTLDACTSTDADDPDTICTTDSGGTTTCGILSFQWACASSGLATGQTCATPPAGPQTSCRWSVPPSTFSVGNYIIELTVSKVGKIETASTDVRTALTWDPRPRWSCDP